MHAGIHPLGFEPLEIGLRARRQRQEVDQQALLARRLALRQQLPLVVGVGDVLVAVHAAGMACEQLVAVVDADPIGIGLERQAQTRVARGHRVVIAVERDAELLGRAHRAHPRQIESGRIERQQMRAFLLEVLDRSLVGLAVNAHVGHRVDPEGSRRLQRGEVGQRQAGQQVLLDVADGVLDASLLIAGAHVARRDREAPVPGEGQVLRVQYRGRADQALQDGRLQVVDLLCPGTLCAQPA